MTSIGIDTRSVAIDFETPKQEQFGDITTNVAFALAKEAKLAPRAIAEKLRSALSLDSSLVEKVDVAGAGFLNFSFTRNYFQTEFTKALANNSFGKSKPTSRTKTLVEFVSVNPTGPLHLGHGRQTVLGDVLSNILQWTGHDVTREYYFNNAGKQIDMLGASVLARYRALLGQEENFPEDGYQGTYIRDIASSLREKNGDQLTEKNLPHIKTFSVDHLFSVIKATLSRIGLQFDVYYNESSLYETGKIEALITELKRRNLVYEKRWRTLHEIL